MSKKRIFSINLKQFEILNDVLSEIEEYRVYEDEDLEALEQLQDMFSYSDYCDFKASCEESEVLNES